MSTGSSRRSLLLSRDTLLGLVVVIVLAALCVALGVWQYGRYETRRDEAATVRTNYDAAPVDLDQVLPDIDAPLDGADDWTPVSLEGSYCTEVQCLLHVRNRQISGEVGFWQLVPFTTEDGTTLLVVRGWVPSDGEAAAPVDPAPVPEGELTLTVRLRPAEPVLDRAPPPGQTHSVNPGQSAGLMELEDPRLVAQAYGELVEEDPAAERPTPLPSPDTSLGPHLSYAFQWWIFALFFPAALIFRLRRQFQDLAADEAAEREDGESAADGQGALPARAENPAEHDDARPGRGAPRARPHTDHRPRRAMHARRRGQDEEEEDALIDQQNP
ncbi:SURF1 family cytochrome oxidase biogenesis protein [Brachybacterium sp. AOP43-C2-M15]|uniref:SURF1 family cytochrome oxidase biogenesis protein n=1 Tax=Brachybacterium sp. AOP43-C2-M15 TaxID=3457661 RepID=UPI00403322E0